MWPVSSQNLWLPMYINLDVNVWVLVKFEAQDVGEA